MKTRNIISLGIFCFTCWFVHHCESERTLDNRLENMEDEISALQFETSKMEKKIRRATKRQITNAIDDLREEVVHSISMLREEIAHNDQIDILKEQVIHLQQAIQEEKALRKRVEKTPTTEKSGHVTESSVDSRGTSDASIIDDKANGDGGEDDLYCDPSGPYQPESFEVLACNGLPLHMHCPNPGHRIRICRANYGRTAIHICNRHGDQRLNTRCFSSNAKRIVAGRCDGKSTCSVRASSKTFGDSCPSTPKYLEIHYQCEPDTTITG